MVQFKTSTLITHIIGWLIFLCLPLLFIGGQYSDEAAFSLMALPYYWLFFLCYAVIFYTHTFFLLPELFYKKHYALYAISLIALFALVYFVRPFDNLISLTGDGPRRKMRPPPMPDIDFPPPGRPHHGRRHGPMPLDIISLTLFLLTIALSFAIVASRNLRASKQRTLQAEKEKAEAELSTLKAQINPHFLFNTLNNIYSLAVSGLPNTAPSILKLSNILRYVTEEVSNNFVSLKAEIDCIKDYIDLQKLRLTQKTNIQLNVHGETNNIVIAPMILMTFIENAFKFGVSAHEQSQINITIETTGKKIIFTCSNSLFEVRNTESTGIGLTNTRKRLDYIYNNNYSLNLKTGNNLYTVILEINT